MEPIVEIKGVGKKYNIAHQKGGYIALRDILANVFRSPFQFAKQKAKKIVGIATHEDFWALKDVSFNIQRGDVIGVIGRNGSGKSTLLKILTGITPPTEGEIIMRGRVASLLEVGTGFHPELTGRENIFLNGAILGMQQKEIARKFDDIVAFAGIEKFLDTPVKRYSSGMYVRLAFSVAAHMEPDILLVDEVLAVGDADFQKKCLGKMEEVTKKDGRTIVFVSHNMEAIARLCKTCVLLDKGVISMIGPTSEVIAHYLRSKESVPATYNRKGDEFDPTTYGRVDHIQIQDKNGIATNTVPAGLPWQAKVVFTLTKPTPHFVLAMSIRTDTNLLIRTSWSAPENLEAGTYEAYISDARVNLISRTYSLDVGLSSFKRAFEFLQDCVTFKITEEGAAFDSTRILSIRDGVILDPMDINISKQ
jgi:lipopolysaccharide transport system ATP-binding protein